MEFKLASAAVHAAHASDIQALRRRALNLGQGTRFLIDISRFEYVEDKQPVEFDGYLIYVYSPLMIVCEKLRAICQQMPEYGPVIKRERPGTARARDFLDIAVLVDRFALDLTAQKSCAVLTSMFAVKQVPLAFLGLVHGTRAFHQAGFASVKDTVAAGFDLGPFDGYFDFVIDQIERLKPLWYE